MSGPPPPPPTPLPFWNLSAIIWFLCPISSLILSFFLPVLLPCLVISLLMVHSPDLFVENSQQFSLRVGLFCMALVGQEMIVGGVCSLLPYGAGICHFFPCPFLFLNIIH